MKLGEGVGFGQVIDPNHILEIANALTGKTTNDIQINGSFSVTGSALITQDLNVLGAISASKLIIDKDRAKIGNSFIVNNNFVLINNTKFVVKGETFIQGNTQISNNLIVTGSTLLKGASQHPNAKTFLILDEHKIVGYTTGSIKDHEVEKFKFNHIDTEDSTSFKGKINNISIYQTDNIKDYILLSKKDISPTWIKHNSIEALQQWINNINDEIFWIKINVIYKDHLTGKSEVIFKYSN